MRILSIRIKNLASLEGEYLIDFTTEPLRSSGIFAITGPTGAGKSTLLDAMCLALFAQTPRHTSAKEARVEIADIEKEKISQSDVRGILRKGSTDGMAEVGFVGVDGKSYKALWSVKRARNKATGALQQDTVELTDLTTNTNIPGKKTETLKNIERLVGLNFEQFTRSVLLAQGDFTAFLKAEKKEKSSLLEKLTGTEIYSEISKRIYQNCKSAESELLLLNKLIEGITILSDDEKLKLQEQVKTFEYELAKYSEEKKETQDEINWHNVFRQLHGEKDKTEKELEAAKAAKAAAEVDLIKLSKIESVEGARIKVGLRDNNKLELERKKRELAELEEILEEIDKQLAEAQKEVGIYETALKQKEDSYNQAKPTINEVRELDIKIEELKKQLETAEKVLSEAIKKKDDHIAALSQKEKELVELNGKKEVLASWKEKNKDKEPIALNKTLILSKLTDIENETTNENVRNRNLLEIQKKIVVTEGIIKKLEEQEGAINVKFVVLENKLNEKQLILNSLEIENIREERRILRQLQEQNTGAKSCWDMLYKDRSALDKLKEKITVLTSKLNGNKAEQFEVIEKLKASELKRDSLKQMLDRVTLENSKDVVSLRGQLVVEEPCPVCGSVHHPYAAENKKAENIVAVIKRDHKESEAVYESLFGRSKQLENEIKNVEREIEEASKNEAEISNSIDRQLTTWQKFEGDRECLQLPDAMRSLWFENKLLSIVSAIATIDKKELEYIGFQKEVNDLKEESHKTGKEIAENNNQLQHERNVLENYRTQIESIDVELSMCKHRRKNLEQELNSFFKNEGWLENWQKSPLNFKNKVEEFANDWNGKLKLIEETGKECEKYETIISGLKEQSEGFEHNLNSAKTIFDNRSDEHTKLTKERIDLFGNKAIAEIENKYSNDIQAARKKWEDSNAKENSWRQSWGEKTGNKQSKMDDIRISMDSLKSCNQEIESFITEYNRTAEDKLDEVSLLDLLGYTDDWIACKRKLSHEINSAIIHAYANSQSAGARFDEHVTRKKSDALYDDLLIRLESYVNLIEEKTVAKHKIEFALIENEKNNEKAGDLFKKIELQSREVENRQKLNDLIGSADGEKFRQLAQEYTLDVLLGFANVHIKSLAGRYKLERIPNTLALQVIDMDMGNEVRSVHSLSGGESFLVSLSLALGLASLSSNKMKVESLFIDEGFGSLDAETLAIAMDALENLHQMGRKVGVISHVREMTERIPTQIRVLKQAGGKSKLEIV